MFQVGAEYRARVLRINPLDLSGLQAANLGWGEQRLRLDITMARRGVAALFLQMDLLDGVLFGDNGSFGRPPTISSGLGVSSKQANRAGWRIGLIPGGDPFDVRSYVPELREIEPLRINYAYGEVLLPFGFLRFGRQPIGDIGNISINDGRSGRNRWGVSWYHQSADRFLFGTKLSEVFKRIICGSQYKVDASFDRGLFIGLAYDFLVQDEIYRSTDDLQQVAVQLDWKVKGGSLAGLKLHEFRLTGTLSYRWEKRYETSIFALPLRLRARLGPFRLAADFTYFAGSTRELSAGFSELTGRPVVDQTIAAYGARVVLEGKIGRFTIVGEWAFASGDEDPRPDTPMTMLSWPRDTNLGVLLFEHTLAFQTSLLNCFNGSL